MLFDWLVTGHVLTVNPAHAVRGPKYVLRKGKTPVLNVEEARTLLDSIKTDAVVGLRIARSLDSWFTPLRGSMRHCK